MPTLALAARRGLLALVALVLASLLPASGAAAATTGQLAWTEYNVYETAAPAGTNRTWLGYVTGLAAGTATPSGAATGPTVGPTSARGASQGYTAAFPIASAEYDAETGLDTIELEGTLTFSSTAHGFEITVEDPRVVLDGGSGQLFASGEGAGAQPTYDRSQPLFDLDLSGAETATHVDGTRTITGIVPSLATANWAFPATYGVGAGPDRTPNTFGAFSLTLRNTGDGGSGETGPKGDTGAAGATGATGAAGADGPAGVAGPAGAVGPQGARGARGATPSVKCRSRRRAGGRVTVTCRRVAKGGKATVRLTRGGKTYARGVAARNSGRLTLRATRRLRRGIYTLHVRRGGTTIAHRVTL